MRCDTVYYSSNVLSLANFIFTRSSGKREIVSIDRSSTLKTLEEIVLFI